MSPASDIGLLGLGVALWGTLGVLALLGHAVVRLTPLALEPIRDGSLTGGQWALLVGWVVLQCYSEGYLGFQRAFSPRVVARAFHVARHPRALRVALAPIFCMALFDAPGRRLAAAWGLVGAIVILVLVIHQLPQPWRGIVDAGVVVGLVWGIVAIVAFFVQALAGRPLPTPADVPD